MSTHHTSCRDIKTHSLRPVCKPVEVFPSTGFKLAIADEDYVSIIPHICRIFLRLGFDGFIGENTKQGFQLRIYGNNLNTGEFCKHHVVYRRAKPISREFIATVKDKELFYEMALYIKDNNHTQEEQ